VSNSIDLSQPQEVEASSTEVNPAPKRKRYTAAVKLRIIAEADTCTAPGELAALLRREGIYFSTLTDFRKQKAHGDLDGKPAQAKLKERREPKQERRDPKALHELAASEREVRRLRRELERAKAMLDLQKKVLEVMGLSLQPTE
jgi:transposase